MTLGDHSSRELLLLKPSCTGWCERIRELVNRRARSSTTRQATPSTQGPPPARHFLQTGRPAIGHPCVVRSGPLAVTGVSALANSFLPARPCPRCLGAAYPCPGCGPTGCLRSAHPCWWIRRRKRLARGLNDSYDLRAFPTCIRCSRVLGAIALGPLSRAVHDQRRWTRPGGRGGGQSSSRTPTRPWNRASPHCPRCSHAWNDRNPSSLPERRNTLGRGLTPCDSVINENDTVSTQRSARRQRSPRRRSRDDEFDCSSCFRTCTVLTPTHAERPRA